jgi:hypothetical protein
MDPCLAWYIAVAKSGRTKDKEALEYAIALVTAELQALKKSHDDDAPIIGEVAEHLQRLRALLPKYCTRCDRPLSPEKTVWLELDLATNTYHPVGTVPPAESQGEFPFGLACAKRALREGER